MNINLELNRDEVTAIVLALSNTRVPTLSQDNQDFLIMTLRDAVDAADAAADRDAESLPGEDMDGDFDSAMASAGFGTDEDYGGGCSCED
jgi:hypothetical protein